MPVTFDFLVPTRERPDNVRRLIRSVLDNASSEVRCRFFFYVDEGDKATEDAIPAIKEEFRGVHLGFASGRQVPLAMMWNILLQISGGDDAGEILWCGGDDICFRTHDWDKLVNGYFAQVPDKCLLVYGDDKLQGEQLASHPFVSRRACDILEHVYPGTGMITLTDLWVHVLYDTLGRLRYCPDLVTEHMHPLVGKGKPDQTYLWGLYVRGFPASTDLLPLFWPQFRRDLRLLAKEIPECNPDDYGDDFIPHVPPPAVAINGACRWASG